MEEKAPPSKRAKTNSKDDGDGDGDDAMMSIDDGDDDDDDNNNTNNDNGKPKYRLLSGFGEHKRAVSSVKFAPTRLTKRSALCASSSADGVIKLWDVQDSFQSTTTATASSSQVSSTTITAKKDDGGDDDDDDDDDGDDDAAAAAADRSADGIAKKTTTTATTTDEHHADPRGASMEPKLSCTGHSRGINEICWNPVSPLLASASDDKTVRDLCVFLKKVFRRMPRPRRYFEFSLTHPINNVCVYEPLWRSVSPPPLSPFAGSFVGCRDG